MLCNIPGGSPSARVSPSHPPSLSPPKLKECWLLSLRFIQCGIGRVRGEVGSGG